METRSVNTQEAEPGLPHDALYLVFAYLPVFDLLSASQVCKSFNESINNDVLLWLDIYVDKPLNTKISDDTLLLKIASKVNGRIRSLALIDCTHVTDHALQQIVLTNPFIEKLYLPGCTGLSPEGILRAVETLTSTNNKLKAIKICNIHNITKEHLISLRNCFSSNISTKQEPQKIHPSYLHNRNIFSLRQDPTHSIDIDICPYCCQVTQVFDCPTTYCEKKVWEKCRGCMHCIPRCEDCGMCVEDDFYADDRIVEIACGDALCLECWLQRPKCDFCNKAFCKKHAAAATATQSGLVCSVCCWIIY